VTHPLDLIAGSCPDCGRRTLQRYDATQILSDPVTGGVVEARLYTCARASGGCGQTYARDSKPRPDLTEADLLTILDKRVR